MPIPPSSALPINIQNRGFSHGMLGAVYSHPPQVQPTALGTSTGGDRCSQ